MRRPFGAARSRYPYVTLALPPAQLRYATLRYDTRRDTSLTRRSRTHNVSYASMTNRDLRYR